jgi:uncharacterized secreted protein with C-terminal beta-propeller domain
MSNHDPNAGSKKTPEPSWLAVAVILTAVLSVAAYYVMQSSRPEAEQPNVAQPPRVQSASDGPAAIGVAALKFETFESEEDFVNWLSEAETAGDGFGFGGMMTARGVAMDEIAVSPAPPSAVLDLDQAATGNLAGAVERYSATNVQVAGVDEPDRLKTDGTNIYYSPERVFYPLARPVAEPFAMEGEAAVSSDVRFAPEGQPAGAGVAAVQAWPVDDLKLLGRLGHQGEMLLSGDHLLVFDGAGVHGYDVSDASAPRIAWEYDYADRYSLEAARLVDGEVYLVTRAWLDPAQPCPARPFMWGEAEVTIPCAAVWHGPDATGVDTTFAVARLSPATGEVLAKTAFVGAGGSTTVSMSADHLYVASEIQPDLLAFAAGFLHSAGDLVPRDVLARLDKVLGYDLSLAAKQAELGAVMQRWMAGLDADERLRVESEMANKVGDYWRLHAREFGGTGLVKMNLGDLSLAATGRVPGRLLNQFALDEHEGNLRAAVTVGGRGGFGWQFGLAADDSVSDVYVLDGDLRQLGAATGMGEGERIYAVRFLGDKGYVVTFRETDPLYVLDLRDPSAPRITGELKIPGYSSYLHPLAPDRILGVGKEGSQVKLSIFDVSDAAAPREVAKYSLNEYWSDVLGTHHAFLADPEHSVFFMPGNRGGYVFSYADDRLAIERTVAGAGVSRAAYVNDYLYLVGDDGIVALDETDWQRAGELKF